MKKHLTTLILTAVLLAGAALLLYPAFSDYWNSLRQSRAIASYTEQVAALDGKAYEDCWEAAQAYNRALADREDRYALSERERAEYEGLLNAAGDGVMGCIEIPKIACTLPVYHGTEESVLQIAAGHLAGTSLPVGGEGSHCVLSGHRGLPSAKLFSSLDRLEVGDTFLLRVLDEVLTYEVDRIRVVEPHELDGLEIEPGQDLCTLVTCTPYGVNSHRLLVRGKRVENRSAAPTVRVTADAAQIEPVIAAPLAAIPMLLVPLAWTALSDRRRSWARERRERYEQEHL